MSGSAGVLGKEVRIGCAVPPSLVAWTPSSLCTEDAVRALGGSSPMTMLFATLGAPARLTPKSIQLPEIALPGSPACDTLGWVQGFVLRAPLAHKVTQTCHSLWLAGLSDASGSRGVTSAPRRQRPGDVNCTAMGDNEPHCQSPHCTVPRKRRQQSGCQQRRKAHEGW